MPIRFMPVRVNAHYCAVVMETMSPLLTLDNPYAQPISQRDSALASGDSDHSLVSVVIACYNGERYLQEAIESALAQSYPRVEIIVVDDGSTDGSSEIAKKFPVRYIRQDNRGLTESRNLGIRASRGNYVVFLDADDRLRPDAIETGLRVMVEHPECAMTVGDHRFISSDGSFLSDSRKACLHSSHYEELLKSNFIEMISSVLFRRSVLVEIGGFDTTLRVAEDYELYLRIARVYPICCHPALIAEYRLHQANASRNSELMLRMTLQVLRRQGQYVRTDRGRLFAFLEGLRNWRRQYGRQLALELAGSSSVLEVDHLRRKFLLLLAHYPQGLLAFVLLRLSPGLDKKVRLSVISAQERLPSPGFRAWFHNAKSRSSTQFG
jgi:glycosyltransferase involved in cell wall biosynthesis